VSTITTVETVADARPGEARRFVLPPKVAMAILGFASGLPLVVFTGTIAAWLTGAGVNTKAIGVLSMAGLPYAFKFLWSPAITAAAAPLYGRVAGTGRLRGWIMLSLTVIAPVFALLPLVDPAASVGVVALLVLLGVFASATQDIAIGGWRIRVARDEAELDSLVTIEQFSYRASTFIGGALALVLADRLGWGPTWWLLGGLFAACFASVFALPDPEVDVASDREAQRVTLGATLPPARRKALLLPVLAVWGVSLLVVFGFMFYVLAIDPETSTRGFTFWAAPIIALACVGAPVAATLVMQREAGSLEGDAAAEGVWDRLYVNLLEPFAELVTRLRWGLLPFLFFVLFYRYADGIWGALAYPFYLGAPEKNGGLGYTLSEVSAASKVFGVFATMAGFALGGVLMKLIGKMPALLLGAVLAAGTNLLYADLALGGSATDAFIGATRISFLFEPVVAFANLLSPDGATSTSDSLGRLLVVIAAENLSVGIASVVFVAYLSSVVNKKYAAVQYAIFASVYTLVATLSRPILGELADERGFAFVFVLTAVLGLLGVAASVIEWVRTGRRAAALPDRPDGERTSRAAA
jgi:PAT family beta-lactamase induction signal transducer AmpG